MPNKAPLSFQLAVQDDFVLVNECIQQQLHSDVALVSKIGDYIIHSGGKRLRPLLVLLSARACGYEGTRHIELAAVIEFLHTATLLHDDVVDESSLRRGNETANAIWGNAPSVLVGDFLYSRAFQMMVELENFDILKVLSHATNVIAEGEVMQLMNIHDASITEAHYMEVIRCKTAMLFEASTHTAALLSNASADVAQGLKQYGSDLGIAFQLVDDLLDYTGDSEAMGKNLGDDLAEGKPTLPLLYVLAHGNDEQKAVVTKAIENGGLELIDDVVAAVRSCGALEYTAERAKLFALQAKAALHPLPDNPIKTAMMDLADFSIERAY